MSLLEILDGWLVGVVWWVDLLISLLVAGWL